MLWRDNVVTMTVIHSHKQVVLADADGRHGECVVYMQIRILILFGKLLLLIDHLDDHIPVSDAFHQRGGDSHCILIQMDQRGGQPLISGPAAFLRAFLISGGFT